MQTSEQFPVKEPFLMKTTSGFGAAGKYLTHLRLEDQKQASFKLM